MSETTGDSQGPATSGPAPGQTAGQTPGQTSGQTPGQALEPYDPARFESDRTRVRRGFWTKLRRVAGRIPFAEEAAAAYYCASDRATPTHVKAVLMAALAYFVIPTDMIPDVLTGLGFTDDATVFFLAWQTVTKHVTQEHREKARTALARLRNEGDLPESG